MSRTIPNANQAFDNDCYEIPTAELAKLRTDSRAKQGTLTYTDILLEELCEAIEEATAGNIGPLRTELIQVAAVAVAWVEKIDREWP